MNTKLFNKEQNAYSSRMKWTTNTFECDDAVDSIKSVQHIKKNSFSFSINIFIK